MQAKHFPGFTVCANHLGHGTSVCHVCMAFSNPEEKEFAVGARGPLYKCPACQKVAVYADFVEQFELEIKRGRMCICGIRVDLCPLHGSADYIRGNNPFLQKLVENANRESSANKSEAREVESVPDSV